MSRFRQKEKTLTHVSGEPGVGGNTFHGCLACLGGVRAVWEWVGGGACVGRGSRTPGNETFSEDKVGDETEEQVDEMEEQENEEGVAKERAPDCPLRAMVL